MLVGRIAPTTICEGCEALAAEEIVILFHASHQPFARKSANVSNKAHFQNYLPKPHPFSQISPLIAHADEYFGERVYLRLRDFASWTCMASR